MVLAAVATGRGLVKWGELLARSYATEPSYVQNETRNMKYVAGSLLACTMLMASRLALAGPPFMTDDPEPVEYQHHELYLSSQQVKTQDGKSGTIPHLEYNYGAAPDLQLHIIVPYAFNSPVNGQRESGPGDVELGAKYRFMQETDNRPMVGIFPLVETHTGDANKGSETVPPKCTCLFGCKRDGASGRVMEAAATGSTTLRTPRTTGSSAGSYRRISRST